MEEIGRMISKEKDVTGYLDVFKYLSIKERIKMERVSRGWEKASRSSWIEINTLDLTPFVVPSFPEDGDFQRAKAVIESLWMRAARYVKTLKMDQTESGFGARIEYRGTDRILVDAMRKIPPEQLEHLRLMGLGIEAETMDNLRTLFRESNGGPEKIRSLEFEVVRKSHTNLYVYINSFAALLHSFTSLKKLNILQFPRHLLAIRSVPDSVEDIQIWFAGNTPLFEWSGECAWLAKKQLKKIKIMDTITFPLFPLNFDAFSVCKQLESVCFTIVPGGFHDPKWLAELPLRELNLSYFWPDVGDEFLGPFLRAARNAPLRQSLKHLVLDGTKKLSSETIKGIAIFANLEVFRMDSSNIVDDQLYVLLLACPKLKALCVCDITNKTMKIIGENCKNLDKLDILGCFEVTDKGLENLVAARFQPNQLVSPPFLTIFAMFTKVTKNQFHPKVKVFMSMVDEDYFQFQKNFHFTA